jgi:hypothetical protein
MFKNKTSTGNRFNSMAILMRTFRDTMENSQSEFLQLMWQVAGLSILWYIGSSQSKESDDRLEEKIDLLIQRLDSEKGKQKVQELDKKYPQPVETLIDEEEA